MPIKSPPPFPPNHANPYFLFIIVLHHQKWLFKRYCDVKMYNVHVVYEKPFLKMISLLFFKNYKDIIRFKIKESNKNIKDEWVSLTCDSLHSSCVDVHLWIYMYEHRICLTKDWYICITLTVHDPIFICISKIKWRWSISE